MTHATPLSTSFVFSAKGAVLKDHEPEKVSFKGYVDPSFAMIYLQRILETEDGVEGVEELLVSAMNRLRKSTTQGKVQVFLNLVHFWELQKEIINRLNVLLNSTAPGGYEWRRHENEDEADVEVTVSVLEDYEVLPPAKPPTEEGDDIHEVSFT